MLRKLIGALAICGLAAGAGAETGDVRVDNPTVDGALIDWCVSQGQGCGWEGAHAFCRERGYDHAIHFETVRPGRTFLPNGNHFCSGPGCVGFTTVICRPVAAAATPSPPPPPPVRVHVDQPLHQGLPVDWCRHWGQDCGWGGATGYCQMNGYRRAVDWSVQQTSSSIVPSENMSCRGPGCTSFRHVVCEGVLQPNGPPPSGNE